MDEPCDVGLHRSEIEKNRFRLRMSDLSVLAKCSAELHDRAPSPTKHCGELGYDSEILCWDHRWASRRRRRQGDITTGWKSVDDLLSDPARTGDIGILGSAIDGTGKARIEAHVNARLAAPAVVHVHDPPLSSACLIEAAVEGPREEAKPPPWPAWGCVEDRNHHGWLSLNSCSVTGGF